MEGRVGVDLGRAGRMGYFNMHRIAERPRQSRTRIGRRRVAVLAIAAALVSGAATPAAATTPPTGFQEDTLATGFSSPTAVAFAADGRKFVAEKSGRVMVVTATGTTLTTPLLDIRAKVNSFSDRGLLGIATDKDFATNGYLYLLYVYELNPMLTDTDAPMVSRLTRVTVRPDNTLVNPSDPETVILGTDVSGPCPTPDNLRDCIPADYKWHVIGTVRSDPIDGTLWVGTGDTHPHAVNSTSYRPYDESTFAGKIIHIDRQGRGLAGHPFCPTDSNLTHTCTKIYAKGFRNPFRFTLRPGKGPVVGDVGAGDREEMDLVKPGGNYGWPCYEGTLRTPLYDQESRCAQEYAKEGTAGAATPPSWDYPHSGGATIVAGPVYTGTRYPAEYRNDVFVGDYVQGWVKHLDVDSSDRVVGATDFATDWPTGVDLQAVPGSGDVGYVDLGYGAQPPAIRRFSYTGAANGPPTARASATPTSGSAPLAVAFSSSGSTDPDGDALSYNWDFGDGSTRSTQANPSHTYGANGTYTATLTVSDGKGNSDADSVAISVGNRAPTASIAAPADESSYRDGQQIDLRGSATDPEDGALSGSSLSWEVLLHHGSHIHQHTTASGAQASFTTAIDHDADSYYEVRLTAVDSSGLRDTKTVDIRPQTSNFTLASSPAGAPLSYAGTQAAPAPFTKRAAVGFRASVSALDSFTVGGTIYRFQGWSDGGARQHVVTVPATDTTLTARYAPTAADTFVFTPRADVSVDSSRPSTSNGTSRSLRVDTTPVAQSFLRFAPTGLAGRQILSAQLRMYQRDASDFGGRVSSISSTAWTESMTWATRPPIDGSELGRFGAVQADQWYEAEIGAAAVSGGAPLSLAVDSTSPDASIWASREHPNQPQLVVKVAPVSGLVTDGMSEVASPTTGSSNPTFYAGNRRLAITDAGRLLTIHGGSASIRLAWRDPSGGWQRRTTGANGEGLVLSGSGSGDLPTSIAVAKDRSGVERAWVVWSGRSASSRRSVQMARLDDLDAPGGPTIGPVKTVDAPALGAFRADVAFERAPDGTQRGVLVWSRQTGEATFEIVTGWFTDLGGSSTPAIHDVKTIYTTADSSNRFASVVPAANGTRVLARSTSGAMRVYAHASAAPLTAWTASAVGAPVSSSGSPTGVGLDNGDLLAAADADTSGVVKVQRFTAGGVAATPELTLSGYTQPTLASDGAKAWLLMVRLSDGYVVSRKLTPGVGWDTADTVEIGAQGGGNHAWPNAIRQTDGRLRFVVRGPAGASGRSSVLAFQRGL